MATPESAAATAASTEAKSLIDAATSIAMAKVSAGMGKLLVLTQNEGHMAPAPGLMKRVLAEYLSAAEAIHAVVLARQESWNISDPIWDESLAAFGFGHKAADVEQKECKLSLYTREPDDVTILTSFVTVSPNVEHKDIQNKGCAVVVARLMGLTCCIAGCHLDGNIAPLEDRIAQLPLAVLRSVANAGRIDVAIFVGDVNCALEPTSVHEETEDDTDTSCGDMLASEIASFRAVPSDKGTVELSPRLRDGLQHGLATQSGRARLIRQVDGCPKSIPISADLVKVLDRYKEGLDAEAAASQSAGEADIAAIASCGISELCLQPMPTGSLPTYRLTTGHGQAVSALIAATGEDDREMQRLYPSMTLSTEAVNEIFFADAKAGILKKRGDMIRLNLGWMDRMYLGIRQDSGSAVADVTAEQGIPLLVQDNKGCMMDHAFIPWVLEIKPR